MLRFPNPKPTRAIRLALCGRAHGGVDGRLLVASMSADPDLAVPQGTPVAPIPASSSFIGASRLDQGLTLGGILRSK
ncbi:MAG: hypothetical protein AAF628_23955 [Planctomycetota bacterium]